MKRLSLLAILLSWGMAGSAQADSLNTVANETTAGAGRITVTVFNDAGATIVSGAPVVWDTDDTEYDRNGYPYITTTTSADDVDTAGVMLTGSCADQTLCEIVTRGYAPTRMVLATVLTEDTVVSTSTTTQSIGDSTAGNNVCYLGVLREAVDVDTGSVCAPSAVCRVPVQVDVTCVP